MNYRNYTWVGNRISREDMARLYKLKMVTKRRITDMVAELSAPRRLNFMCTGRKLPNT